MRTHLLGLLLLPGFLLTVGCAHTQLRHNTVSQASTVSDIYQQQVLDNLAKFARDPNSLPHFAVATGGINDVRDSVDGGLGLKWNHTRFTGADLSGGGGRTMSENWSLNTVSDPRKLELMRCAFQNAVAGVRPLCDDSCPDCRKRLNHFYTGDANIPPAHPSDPSSSGSVNSACLGTGWFCVGCEKCAVKIRRQNPCCLVGVHCGCAVWVTPGHGTNELAKLTLAILDFAIHDPPVKKSKEVVAYLDAVGGPATASTATFKVSARVNASGDSRAILSPAERTAFDNAALRQAAIQRLRDQQGIEFVPKARGPEDEGDSIENAIESEMEKIRSELFSKSRALVPASQGEIQSEPASTRVPSMLQTPADQLFQLQQRLVD